MHILDHLTISQVVPLQKERMDSVCLHPIGGQRGSGTTEGILMKFGLQTFDNDTSDIAFSKGFAVDGPRGEPLLLRLKRTFTVSRLGATCEDV